MNKWVWILLAVLNFGFIVYGSYAGDIDWRYSYIGSAVSLGMCIEVLILWDEIRGRDF